MADITVGTVAEVAGKTKSEYGTAGVTITHGQPVYKNTADSNRLYLADADLSLAAAQVVGVSLAGASAGEPIKYATAGDLDIGGLTAGTVYVLSATAGKICPSADLDTSTATNYATLIGVSLSATRIRLAIANSDVVNP